MQTPHVNLILLPGMDGTAELFAPFIAALHQKIEHTNIKIICVAYPTNKMLNYAQLITLASAYIPQNQPYILLGESFSGPIAIALAHQNSQHLKGLILACTFARNPRPQWSRLHFFIPKFPINALTMPVANQFLMAGVDNDVIKKMLFSAVKKVQPKVMRARLTEVIEVDFSKNLQQISAPILYLQGKNDYLVPASAGEYIVEIAKNIELIRLDAPHMLLQIVPEAAAEYVQIFIKKVLKNH